MATFLVATVALTLMRAVPPAPDAEGVNVRAAIAGLRYAASRQDLLGSYLVDINAMFFGMPMALFPQIASGLGGPAVLGLLYTAPSVGSLLATVTSGWTRLVRHHGRAIAFAAASWGIAIVAFGFAPSLWVALLALAAAGAADMISGLFRMTLWNQTIPDAMRGRLAGIEMISYTSGPAHGKPRGRGGGIARRGARIGRERRRAVRDWNCRAERGAPAVLEVPRYAVSTA